MKRLASFICLLALSTIGMTGQTTLQINSIPNALRPKYLGDSNQSTAEQAQKFGFNDALINVMWSVDDWYQVWLKGDDYVPMDRPFRTSATFPKSTIKLYWERGYDIGIIRHEWNTNKTLPNAWAVSFYKGNNTGQAYKTVTKSNVRSELKNLVNAGKRIRAVEYVDFPEEILIVYEDGKGEVMTCDWSSISQSMKKANDLGWRVSRIARGGEILIGGLLGDFEDAYHLLLTPKNGGADDKWGKVEDMEYMQAHGYVPKGMHKHLASLYTYEFGILFGKVSNDEVIVGSEAIEVVNGKGSLVSPFSHEDPTKTTSSGVRGAASAVVVDALNGFLVTNYHVVEGASNLSVIFQSVEYDVAVVATDEANDLALLRIQDSVPQGLRSLPISINDGLGDDIVTAGYPLQSVLGDDIKVTEGIISSTSYLGGSNMYQHSAPITNGSSGGALLDRQGNLAGITQGGYRPDANTENVNAAVKSLMILSLIQGESGCDVIVGDENQSISFSELFRSVVAVKVR